MRRYHIVISVHREIDASKSLHYPRQTFIPKSFFQHLPSHTPRPTTRQNAIINTARKDYRFGPIRIDWIDLGDMPLHTGKEKDIGKGVRPERDTMALRLSACFNQVQLQRVSSLTKVQRSGSQTYRKASYTFTEIP